MKSHGAAPLAAAAAAIGGGLALRAMMDPSGSRVLMWAWRAGEWIINKLSLPAPIPSAPAFVIAFVVGAMCAAVVSLLVWKLEVWAAVKASEHAQQALRHSCGASVEEEMRKLTRRHGR